MENRDDNEDTVEAEYNEHEENEVGNDVQSKRGEEKFQTNLNNFYPPALLFFILYGPYGVGAYNFDITNCLSVENKSIDLSAKTNKNMNKSSMKEKTTKERNQIR